MNLPPMSVRPLNSGDAEAYRALRLRGLKENPTAFGANYSQEAARPFADYQDRVNPAPDGSRCLFGAFAGEELAGTVAFVRPLSEKVQHSADVFGMYVAPEFQRRGFARALMEAVMAHARALGVRQLKLTVTATNEAARALYHSLNFRCCGREPDVLFVDGVFYDEEIYVLRLLE